MGDTPSVTYVPVTGQPFTVSMDLRTMDLDKWIEIDEHYETELAQKRDLLANRRSEVFAALPEGLKGSEEVLAKLVDYLPAHFPDRFPSGIAPDYSVHPLEAASFLVQ